MNYRVSVVIHNEHYEWAVSDTPESLRQVPSDSPYQLSDPIVRRGETPPCPAGEYPAGEIPAILAFLEASDVAPLIRSIRLAIVR
jgi:hypothetical protein